MPKDQQHDSLQGKRVGVIGAGISGLAAASLAAKLGANVLLSDQKAVPKELPDGVRFEVGRHSEVLLKSDILVRSPGVPNNLPILKDARRGKVPIWSELELGAHFSHPKRFVGITGTNGKTTTTALTGELFKAGAKPAVVAGNIGTPLSALVDQVSTRTSVILEISSYQLEDIHAFRPAIGAILNITPDHLEHHGSMTAYADAKARLFENQKGDDVCIFNADDSWCRRLAKRAPARRAFFSRRRVVEEGVFYQEGQVVIRWGSRREEWPLTWELPGMHNVENALAAIAMAVAAGISSLVIRKVLKRFPGVEHRLEVVRTLGGVRYINDSKATNVDSTRVALESFNEPLIVIMGGEGKGSPYRPLAPLIRKHVRQLLLIGQDAPAIERDLGRLVPFERVEAMPKAVARARELARRGDVVLLSPACASFDQYGNYEERGNHFKTLVKALR